MNCSLCGLEANKKIHTIRHSPNFSGDKNPPGDLPNFFFCSQEHRKQWINETREQDQNNIPYLAELDESMNYCEYFERVKGNEGIYKRDGFEYKVNGLWDYKSFEIPKAKEFKQAYIEYFGNFNRFKLHSRYN